MDPNREGYINGRRCEGQAREPTDYRVKELQDLARSLGISYAKKKKNELCQSIREYYRSIRSEAGRDEKVDRREATTSGAGVGVGVGTEAGAGVMDHKGFFDEVTNPDGYIRKVEFKEISPNIPFLIVNLERVMSWGGQEETVFSEIIPDSLIMLDEENVLFLRASIMYKDGHYVAYFFCDGSWWLYDDTVGDISEIGSYRQLIKNTNISTHGVMHFYTHIHHLCDEKWDCGLIGPEWFDQSCYMDSVLFALFSMGNSYVLKQLFRNPLTDSEECSISVKRRIRAELERLDDYFQGRLVERPICRSLRKLFAECRLQTYEDFSEPRARSPSEFLSYLFAIFDVDDKPKTGPVPPQGRDLSADDQRQTALEGRDLSALEGQDRVLHRLTWGTNDPTADTNILFDPSVETILPFVTTSRQLIDFNFIMPFDSFKIRDNAGITVSELIQKVEDVLLI